MGRFVWGGGIIYRGSPTCQGGFQWGPHNYCLYVVLSVSLPSEQFSFELSRNKGANQKNNAQKGLSS